MAENRMSTVERIEKLLDHIGVGEAHFAGSLVQDWAPLISQIPERVKSLTLTSATGILPEMLAPVASRLLVLSGDAGPLARAAQTGIAGLEGVRHRVLKDYDHAAWSDIAADRTDEVVAAILSFLNEAGDADTLRHSAIESEGEFLELTYRIKGAGPPLVLLPLQLAPSQWEPIIPRLAEHCTTIVLGGRHLGMIRQLEQRTVEGFRHIVEQLVGRLRLRSGDTLLDVGCGTGAHDRYITQITSGENPIVGVDHSDYMIKEAIGIARSEGVGQALEFREGDATRLPFEDASFSAVFSITVMEEVDADKMIPQLVRVTRPGGRVGIVIRAVDMPWVVNAPLPAEIKRKAEAPNVMGGGVAEQGCADSSLYARMVLAGLRDMQMFPQLLTFPGRQDWENQARGALTVNEAKIWNEVIERARAEGTFFISQPFHCAVGKKPT